MLLASMQSGASRSGHRDILFQVGGAHAQQCMLPVIPIICGDPIGRAGSQPFIIRDHAHILVLTLAF